jgi:hypothetical protein
MGVNASTLSIVDCDTSPAGTDFSLGSSLILPARGTASITVSGTVKTSTGTNLSDGETVQIKLVGQGSQGSNGVGQSSLNPYTIPSSDVLGRAVPVVGSGTLSASPAYSCSLVQTGLGNQSACLGSFTLSAMKEGITVNTIGIDMSAANAALVTNLTLKYHYGDNNQGAVLGSVITTPSANNPFYMTPVSFGTGRGLDISTSGLTTIDVYGNVPSGAGTIQLTLDPSTSGTGDMTGISASLASPVQLKAVTIQ